MTCSCCVVFAGTVVTVCGLSVFAGVTVTSAETVGYFCTAVAAATNACNLFGGGVGDFFDKFNGCCESEMSTCNSNKRGGELRADGDGRGGDTVADVECGDWKYWQPFNEDEDEDDPLLLGETDCWQWLILVVVITEWPCHRVTVGLIAFGGEVSVIVVVEVELQRVLEQVGELLEDGEEIDV